MLTLLFDLLSLSAILVDPLTQINHLLHPLLFPSNTFTFEEFTLLLFLSIPLSMERALALGILLLIRVQPSLLERVVPTVLRALIAVQGAVGRDYLLVPQEPSAWTSPVLSAPVPLLPVLKLVRREHKPRLGF